MLERQWWLELGDGHKGFTVLFSLHSFVLIISLKDEDEDDILHGYANLTFPEHL